MRVRSPTVSRDQSLNLAKSIINTVLPSLFTLSWRLKLAAFS